MKKKKRSVEIDLLAPFPPPPRASKLAAMHFSFLPSNNNTFSLLDFTPIIISIRCMSTSSLVNKIKIVKILDPEISKFFNRRSGKIFSIL